MYGLLTMFAAGRVFFGLSYSMLLGYGGGRAAWHVLRGGSSGWQGCGHLRAGALLCCRNGVFLIVCVPSCLRSCCPIAPADTCDLRARVCPPPLAFACCAGGPVVDHAAAGPSGAAAVPAADVGMREGSGSDAEGGVFGVAVRGAT